MRPTLRTASSTQDTQVQCVPYFLFHIPSAGNSSKCQCFLYSRPLPWFNLITLIGQLNNLDYTVCIQQEYGFCGTEYYQVNSLLVFSLLYITSAPRCYRLFWRTSKRRFKMIFPFSYFCIPWFFHTNAMHYSRLMSQGRSAYPIQPQ